MRSIWLDVGSRLLMIEKSDEPLRRVDGVGSGPFLIAFAVSETEWSALERALEAAGSPIEFRTEHSSYARDPEGNRVAISHYPLPTS